MFEVSGFLYAARVNTLTRSSFLTDCWTSQNSSTHAGEYLPSTAVAESFYDIIEFARCLGLESHLCTLGIKWHEIDAKATGPFPRPLTRSLIRSLIRRTVYWLRTTHFARVLIH